MDQEECDWYLNILNYFVIFRFLNIKPLQFFWPTLLLPSPLTPYSKKRAMDHQVLFVAGGVALGLLVGYLLGPASRASYAPSSYSHGYDHHQLDPSLYDSYDLYSQEPVPVSSAAAAALPTAAGGPPAAAPPASHTRYPSYIPPQAPIPASLDVAPPRQQVSQGAYGTHVKPRQQLVRQSESGSVKMPYASFEQQIHDVAEQRRQNPELKTAPPPLMNGSDSMDDDAQKQYLALLESKRERTRQRHQEALRRQSAQ